MPSTKPSSRLAARLGQLPHKLLSYLAARLCSDSPALEAAAEECMAAYTPLPQEMVELVLLSPDLGSVPGGEGRSDVRVRVLSGSPGVVPFVGWVTSRVNSSSL